MPDSNPKIDLSHILNLPQNNKVARGALWISHFFKAHEKLLAIAFGLLLVWGVAGKLQDVIIAHDKVRSAQDNTVLAAQVDKNAAQAKVNEDLARNAQQLAADYKKLAENKQAENEKLKQANASLSNKLKDQQAADATLPPDDLAVRIVDLSNAPKGSVIPKPDKTFSVAPDAAVAIAQTLESVPTLTGELANVQQQYENDEALLASRKVEVDGLNQQIGGLQTTITGKDAEIADWKKKYKDDTKTLKDQARRSKGKWFIAGYIAGLATKPIAKFLGL